MSLQSLRSCEAQQSSKRTLLWVRLPRRSQRWLVSLPRAGEEAIKPVVSTLVLYGSCLELAGSLEGDSNSGFGAKRNPYTHRRNGRRLRQCSGGGAGTHCDRLAFCVLTTRPLARQLVTGCDGLWVPAAHAAQAPDESRTSVRRQGEHVRRPRSYYRGARKGVGRLSGTSVLVRLNFWRAATLVLRKFFGEQPHWCSSFCRATASHLLVVLCGRLFGLRSGKLTKRMLTKPGDFYHHQLIS